MTPLADDEVTDASAVVASERVKYLEAALREVAERSGPFSRDPHKHAENVIEHMATVAEQALAGTWEMPDPDEDDSDA